MPLSWMIITPWLLLLYNADYKIGLWSVAMQVTSRYRFVNVNKGRGGGGHPHLVSVEVLVESKLETEITFRLRGRVFSDC